MFKKNWQKIRHSGHQGFVLIDFRITLVITNGGNNHSYKLFTELRSESFCDCNDLQSFATTTRGAKYVRLFFSSFWNSIYGGRPQLLKSLHSRNTAIIIANEKNTITSTGLESSTPQTFVWVVNQCHITYNIKTSEHHNNARVANWIISILCIVIF